jgi:hypothetical protein
MDIIELKYKSWGINDQDGLKKEDCFNVNYNVKRGSTRLRRSSINPSDVEYIRRSRLNSMVDELKHIRDGNNPNLMNELVSSLGADVEFYQCFRLTEEEFVKLKNFYF